MLPSVDLFATTSAMARIKQYPKRRALGYPGQLYNNDNQVKSEPSLPEPKRRRVARKSAPSTLWGSPSHSDDDDIYTESTKDLRTSPLPPLEPLLEVNELKVHVDELYDFVVSSGLLLSMSLRFKY